MLEIKVLTENDEVITYNYADRQDLKQEYFMSNINADIPSNDNIVLSVNNRSVNGIDFDTLMDLINLE